MRRALVAVLCLWGGAALLAEDAVAQEQDKTGPALGICTDKDLAGTFVLMDFEESPPAWETDRYKEFPHQYLAFYPDNLYAYANRNEVAASSAALDKNLMPGGKKNKKQKYYLYKDGTLALYTAKKLNYTFRCVVALKSVGDYKKGDLLLTRYAITTDGKPTDGQILNLYRHWY